MVILHVENNFCHFLFSQICFLWFKWHLNGMEFSLWLWLKLIFGKEIDVVEFDLKWSKAKHWNWDSSRLLIIKYWCFHLFPYSEIVTYLFHIIWFLKVLWSFDLKWNQRGHAKSMINCLLLILRMNVAFEKKINHLF